MNAHHKFIALIFIGLQLLFWGCSSETNESSHTDEITSSETTKEDTGNTSEESTSPFDDFEGTDNLADSVLSDDPESGTGPVNENNTGEQDNTSDNSANSAETNTTENTSPPTDPGNSNDKAPIKLDTKPLKDPNEPKAIEPPNNQPWTALLKKHVTSSGKVSYKGFKSDQAKLNAYLNDLKAHPPQNTWSRNEKLAYWINVYNAFTVDLVVRHYPVKSITDIGSPWDKRFIDIDGKTYTLSEIENKVIRPRFNEPRIHFAVNCASVSCPKLLNEAYEPSKLNSQLTKQTKAYINNPKENTLSAKSAEVSQIFEWYNEDFVKNGTLIDFLNKYANTQIKENAKVTFKQYNWGLNE